MQKCRLRSGQNDFAFDALGRNTDSHKMKNGKEGDRLWKLMDSYEPASYFKKSKK